MALGGTPTLPERSQEIFIDTIVLQYYCSNTVGGNEMLIELDTHSGVPIYVQLIDQIKRLILAGHLPEGEQIEQVRSLAARLKVNPMTVSKAYGLLERDGLLERRRGVGLFIGKIHKAAQDRMKTQTVEDAFQKAAGAAIQMGFSEEEAVDLLRQNYKNLTSKEC
jgi:GntR family transcriptional regulator